MNLQNAIGTAFLGVLSGGDPLQAVADATVTGDVTYFDSAGAACLHELLVPLVPDEARPLRDDAMFAWQCNDSPVAPSFSVSEAGMTVCSDEFIGADEEPYLLQVSLITRPTITVDDGSAANFEATIDVEVAALFFMVSDNFGD